jgi:hypothetical protein
MCEINSFEHTDHKMQLNSYFDMNAKVRFINVRNSKKQNKSNTYIVI